MKNTELKSNPDLVYRVQQGLAPIQEIKIFGLFDEEPTVDTFHREHISWEGRPLSADEQQEIMWAISQVDICTAPNKAVHLDGKEYHLSINSPSGQGKYMWWGALPSAWRSLANVIVALEILIMRRDRAC